MTRPRVVFLCTGNSCRSQMAEGFARHFHGDALEFASAGIETHGLNPRAVSVMAEAGVDISAHQSTTLEELEGDFDFVITVCGHAAETCPILPAGTRSLHRGFDDPPKLAEGLQDEGDILRCYRRVRDEIQAWVRHLPQHLKI